VIDPRARSEWPTSSRHILGAEGGAVHAATNLREALLGERETNRKGGERISETTAAVIVPVVTALGSIITALIGWLARKGMNFMDQKTKVLDEASDLQRKEAIKNKIVNTLTLVARATMQTAWTR
jgi:ABC-type phosphate transport system permease subunit